jgi:hypothetical protein
VASALQTQVVRDFSPLWDVSAVVSGFRSLEDVPLGYIPMAVVNARLPGNRRALHLTLGGAPFALVQYRFAWSLAASHELLELLCDPTGMATAVAPSLGDRHQAALGDRRDPKYVLQGDVEYLLEICDPCETSTYPINGVLVSDFVTPAFYSGATQGGRYSFTGRVPAPLTLLAGGYITWRTPSPYERVWQASWMRKDATGQVITNALRSLPQNVADPEQLVIAPRTKLHGRMTRPATDSATPPFVFRDPGKPSYQAPSADWAAAFRSGVGNLIPSLGGRPHPTIDDLIRFVNKMATKTYNDAFKALSRDERTKELKKYHLKEWNHTWVPVGRVPKPAHYAELLTLLKAQKRAAELFGPDWQDPDMGLWTGSFGR